MISTSDPDVFIESQTYDTIIYVNRDGIRWLVKGNCDRRGLCMIGAVVDGVVIKSVEHLNQLCIEAGKERIDSELDVPVGINFKGCCPFKITKL